MTNMILKAQPWNWKLFTACAAAGLDWAHMSAIAFEASGGNPRYRSRSPDYNFIETELTSDNPILMPYFDAEERPMTEILDRGMRWGLFAVYGELARRVGYNGDISGLQDVQLNIKIAIQIIDRAVKAGADLSKPGVLEDIFQVPFDNVQDKLRIIREQERLLNNFSEVIE